MKPDKLIGMGVDKGLSSISNMDMREQVYAALRKRFTRKPSN